MTSQFDDVVSDVVKAELGTDGVQAVIVQPGLDWDDRPVLDITIVLRKGAKPDRRKMLGLRRLILERLKDEDGLPSLTFMSEADFRRSKLAVA